MLIIGLTGGIGSGKTQVAQLLAEHGAIVIDADEIAHAVTEIDTTGLRQIAREFGSKVLTADGALNRKQLAKIVFADPAARRRLNAIVHPLVRRRMAEITAEVPLEAVVVHDIPLLAENNLAGRYALVLVVEAPRAVRLHRLVARGMSTVDAQARMDSQTTDAQRREIADVIIVNDGSLESLSSTVDEVWQERIVPLLER